MNSYQAIALQSTDYGKPVILDCTLRDGGYYNDWCFEPLLARQLIGALDDAGVDIVEVGFKTPPDVLGNDRFHGLYRYCVEGQLGFLRDYPSMSFAFMINTSEFLSDGAFNTRLMQRCIPPATDSVFDWVRIATHATTFIEAAHQASWLKEKGYNVALNLMGISLLEPLEVRRLISVLPSNDVDVLYFADSFGNLAPEDINFYIDLLRDHFPGKIGLHAHDNQGLAFANSLTAISDAIDFIDCTVTGMGRGAGNLRTEQLLLALSQDVPRDRKSVV